MTLPGRRWCGVLYGRHPATHAVTRNIPPTARGPRRAETHKTPFLCRYVQLPAQVVENWTTLNGFIYFARGGEIASDSRR